MKVMLYTNILISAFVFKSKKMNELIYVLSQKHKIIICSYTIEELEALVETKFNVSLQSLKNFLSKFPFEFVQSPRKIENKLFSIRDDDDYIILHTAIIKDVDIFITGDKDFKEVKIKRPQIMTASEFLEKYN